MEKYLLLTPAQRDALAQALDRTTPEQRHYWCIHSIWLNARGYPVDIISSLLQIPYEVVFRWILSYEKRGLDAFSERGYVSEPELCSQLE